MRSTLALVLTASLVVGAFAMPALAQGAGQGGAHGQSADAGNQTAREARIAALHEARNASLASFQENRTAALAAYHAAHHATKASFLENKTRVQAECAALRNSTEGGNDTVDQCVTDGLTPLIEKARAEHKAQRQELSTKLVAARLAAMQSFAAARASANARFQEG